MMETIYSVQFCDGITLPSNYYGLKNFESSLDAIEYIVQMLHDEEKTRTKTVVFAELYGPQLILIVNNSGLYE